MSGPALLLGLADLVIMTEDAFAYVSGPNMVEQFTGVRIAARDLGGAATLHEYRGRHLYSSLLRHRLEDARDRGYHLATIDAEPMSRRVVSRYGFTEHAKSYIYGWMPVMDEKVVRSLVPDD